MFASLPHISCHLLTRTAGCCMLFGGYYYKTQQFNELGNRACSSLLFLSVIGIIMPTAAKALITEMEPAVGT